MALPKFLRRVLRPCLLAFFEAKRGSQKGFLEGGPPGGA